LLNQSAEDLASQILLPFYGIVMQMRYPPSSAKGVSRKGEGTMIIIGELINAIHKAIKTAIQAQDAEAIQKVAVDQA
jgi:hypothetical protein